MTHLTPIPGHLLTPEQCRQVLEAFAHRFSVVGPGCWYPDDNAWLYDHAFVFTRSGVLHRSMDAQFNYGFPTYNDPSFPFSMTKSDWMLALNREVKRYGDGFARFVVVHNPDPISQPVYLTDWPTKVPHPVDPEEEETEYPTTKLEAVDRLEAVQDEMGQLLTEAHEIISQFFPDLEAYAEGYWVSHIRDAISGGAMGACMANTIEAARRLARDEM